MSEAGDLTLARYSTGRFLIMGDHGDGSGAVGWDAKIGRAVTFDEAVAVGETWGALPEQRPVYRMKDDTGATVRTGRWGRPYRWQVIDTSDRDRVVYECRQSADPCGVHNAGPQGYHVIDIPPELSAFEYLNNTERTVMVRVCGVSMPVEPGGHITIADNSERLVRKLLGGLAPTALIGTSEQSPLTPSAHPV